MITARKGTCDREVEVPLFEHGQCLRRDGRGQTTGSPGWDSAGSVVSEPVISQQDTVLTAVTAWEAQNLRVLREAEARALREQEQEQLLTYTREDAYNAVRGRGHALPRARAPHVTTAAPRSGRTGSWCPVTCWLFPKWHCQP